jgi:hypothetical protein
MRRNDLHVGSLRVLLILGLLAANILAALPRHHGSPTTEKLATPQAVSRLNDNSLKGSLTSAATSKDKASSALLPP